MPDCAIFAGERRNVVIASASEAIQGNREELDCFVASAPRNDGDDAPSTTVILREGGVSSTPRVLGSITGSSEYWIIRIRATRWRMMTNVGILATAFARALQIRLPSKNERAQGRPGARCTRGLACQDAHSNNAHEHTGSAETLRPSLRNGFTAYFVLSPVRPELACHRRQRDTKHHRQLDTCHWGVRTTRLCRPLQPRSSVAALASTAPRPNVSDDGQRPLSRDGMARNKQVIWVKSQGQFRKIRIDVEI
jgi:hypothetical protein